MPQAGIGQNVVQTFLRRIHGQHDEAGPGFQDTQPAAHMGNASAGAEADQHSRPDTGCAQGMGYAIGRTVQVAIAHARVLPDQSDCIWLPCSLRLDGRNDGRL